MIQENYIRRKQSNKMEFKMKKLLLLAMLFVGCIDNPIAPIEPEKPASNTIETIMITSGWDKDIAKIVYKWLIKSNYTNIIVIDNQTICGEFKDYKNSNIEQSYLNLRVCMANHKEYKINLTTIDNKMWVLTIYNVLY